MSERNQPEREDPTWKMHMKTLTNKILGIEIDRKVRKAITEYYKEKGIPEPNWRNNKPYFDEDGNIIRPED